MSDPVYVVALIDVKDHEAYDKEYAQKVMPLFDAVGAQVLAGTTEIAVFEGALAANKAAIIKFPSESLARQWYHSVNYAELKSLRISALQRDGTVFMLPSLT